MRVRLTMLTIASTLTLPAVAEEPPPLPEGFLEFLGSMVEQDGELIDPLDFEPGADAELPPLEPATMPGPLEPAADDGVEVTNAEGPPDA